MLKVIPIKVFADTLNEYSYGFKIALLTFYLNYDIIYQMKKSYF